MHHYLWIPFVFILICTLCLILIFAHYFYFLKKLKENYKYISKFDLIVNHPINDIFKMKFFFIKIQDDFILNINNLIVELKKQIEIQKELLQKQGILIKKMNCLKWRSIHQCIVKNQNILNKNIAQFQLWNNQFWNFYSKHDYEETKAFIINQKIDDIYNDKINKEYLINNDNYKKASQRINDLFYKLENAKLAFNPKEYNNHLNQIIHQIENKIYLISQIIESLHHQKQLKTIINLINDRICNNSFLKQERIDLIKNQANIILSDLNEPFNNLINESKFKIFFEQKLNLYYEQLHDFLSEVTKTKKSHEIFNKYRNKFINDFDFLKIKINLIQSFIDNFEEKTKNISFLEFHEDFDVFKNSISALKQMQIQDQDIVESVSFIKKTHKFYLQLNNCIESFNNLVKKINIETTEFNKISLLINNISNKYYEILGFIEQNQKPIDKNISLISNVDFGFIEIYQSILTNQEQNRIHTSKREIVSSLNSINKRFDDLIDYINKSEIQLQMIYTNLINKAIYFGISSIEIVDKYSIENISDYKIIKTKINSLINAINNKKKNWIG